MLPVAGIFIVLFLATGNWLCLAVGFISLVMALGDKP